MRPLLTAEEARTLDSAAIREIGLPGAVLMETAGRGVFRHLWEHFADRARTGSTAVVCGRGNNGGDGFVVARCLHNLGCRATVLLLGPRDRIRGDAALHLGAYLAGGGRLVEVEEEGSLRPPPDLEGATLVVDAVLGTGLADDVRGLPARAIGWMNAVTLPVVSVDLPSGVASDTGSICGAAVEADLTVTFAYPKRGHYLFPGAALAGRLEVVDIGIPRALVDAISPGLYQMERGDCALPGRPLDGHKGTFGHIVVFGGSPGKEGAGGLAAAAALRSGAGLATVASPAGVCRSMAARLPLELMTAPLAADGPEESRWREELWPAAAAAAAGCQAVVAGPGMGADEGAAAFLGRLLGCLTLPLVLDADALNALAARPDLWLAGRSQAVLTPHPGEAARLLGVSPRRVQEDRVGAVEALAGRFGCAVVLKGAHTLVAAAGTAAFLVPEGNPGMATAGSGDVLSGVVAALLARGLPPLEAARLGSYIHAVAGDLAGAEVGWEGMVAGDLLVRLAPALRLLGGGPPPEQAARRASLREPMEGASNRRARERSDS